MNHQDKERLKELIRMAAMQGSDFIGKKLSDYNRTGRFTDPDIIDMPQEDEIYEKKAGQKVLGILLSVIGYGLGGTLLLIDLVMLSFMVMMEETAAGLILSAVTLPFLGCFGFMAWKGINKIRTANRFHSYVKAIGQDEMCTIRELAKTVGKKEKFVARDVEKMIQKGWFIQGHLDEKKTCLMVTDHMYREYRKLEDERKRYIREEEERRKRALEEEKKRAQEADSRKGLSPEIRNVIEQGDVYVKKIRQCNSMIAEETVSEKIDRMEILVEKIFDRVEQKPEMIGEIHKLMDYYLPTTIKLLETYGEMEAQPVGGDNIRTAKKEIEDTLDTINDAYEKLLDSLFRNAAWDVSSDISVLNTILAQEGLKDDGMKMKQNSTNIKY